MPLHRNQSGLNLPDLKDKDEKDGYLGFGKSVKDLYNHVGSFKLPSRGYSSHNN